MIEFVPHLWQISNPGLNRHRLIGRFYRVTLGDKNGLAPGTPAAHAGDAEWAALERWVGRLGRSASRKESPSPAADLEE